MEGLEIEQLKSKLDNFRTRSALPIVREGDGASDASKFGGKPWLNIGEEYPLCSNCSKPMPLFLQVNLNHIPASLTKKFGEGILQFFFCNNTVFKYHDTGLSATTVEECQTLMMDYDLVHDSVKDKLTNQPLGISGDYEDDVYKIKVTEILQACDSECNSWEPFSAGQLVRIVQPNELCADFELPKIQDAFDPKIIVAWRENDDYPSPTDCVWEFNLEIDDDESDLMYDYLHQQGDKLGGYASWVQSAESPLCPTCDQPMDRLLFQLDSNHNLDWMWGDAGTGYILQCPEHKDRVAFLSQCG
jgi:uncharacterized protein YwqG